MYTHEPAIIETRNVETILCACFKVDSSHFFHYDILQVFDVDDQPHGAARVR
jgi:hypothetical protein